MIIPKALLYMYPRNGFINRWWVANDEPFGNPNKDREEFPSYAKAENYAKEVIAGHGGGMLIVYNKAGLVASKHKILANSKILPSLEVTRPIKPRRRRSPLS